MNNACKKLVIYGLGSATNDIVAQIKENHEIIAYSDSFATISRYKGKPYYPIEKIRELSFDYIIIAVYNRKSSIKCLKRIKSLGIDEEKIIPFAIYAKSELYKIIMDNTEYNDIKGLILGNSYARDGFVEKEMSKLTVNMAVSAQDIYGSYKTFVNSIDCYKQHFENLEYIIFDLYDYNYFNIDVSKSDHFLKHLTSGGVLDAHNYKPHNEMESFEYESFIVRRKQSICEIMDSLFTNMTMNYLIPDKMNRWEHIESDCLIDTKYLTSGVVSKRFESVIEENIMILNKFLEFVHKFNPSIKVIFTLTPHYITMEKALSPILEKWKDEFEEIIGKICDKYGCTFLNYKGRTEISTNHRFYYNINHLNTVGGTALTSILNQDLKKIL